MWPFEGLYESIIITVFLPVTIAFAMAFITFQDACMSAASVCPSLHRFHRMETITVPDQRSIPVALSASQLGEAVADDNAREIGPLRDLESADEIVLASELRDDRE